MASYSGSNIENILERAKRFEAEVLEKLRKQTNAVLFDKEFDDSLEFDVSRRSVGLPPVTSDSSMDVDIGRRQALATHLSSGSLTPDSLSTGMLLVHLCVSGLKVIKHFSCSTRLHMKFFMLINLKLPLNANSFLLNIAEHEKILITSGPDSF